MFTIDEMLTLYIYHLPFFSTHSSIETVLTTRKDSGEELVESGDESEMDVAGGVAELGIRDAAVRLSAEVGCSPSGGVRIPIACTCEKLRNRRVD